MDEETITRMMKQLAEEIDYDVKDFTHLKKAMYVVKIDNGNTAHNEYSNKPLAILGDTVLKLIITEELYDKGLDSKTITNKRKEMENNDVLHRFTCEHHLERFSYNDEFFFEESPEHRKLPNPKHDLYVEAIIGAIYLDRGLEDCKEWVKQYVMLPVEHDMKD